MTWSLPSVTPVLTTAAGLLPSATAIGSAIDLSATYAPIVARDASLATAPITAASRGLTHVSPLVTAARWLSRGLGVVIVGASAIQGAKIVSDSGYSALIHSRQGRAAVLGALGGSLMLIPTPATQLGGAGVLALSAANEFGAFKRFDHTYPQSSLIANGGGTLRTT